MTRPFIVSITGPSGSGKSTLEHQLCVSGGFEKVISTTTRSPRQGEVDAKDYFFVSEYRFSELVRKAQLVEHVEFNGHQYGVTAAEIRRISDMGKPIVVVVEPNGATQIRDYAEQHGWTLFSVFMKNDLATLILRLIKRDYNCGCSPNGDMGNILLARRLISLIQHEVDWQDQGHWNFVCNEFSERTQSNVVGFIKDRWAYHQGDNVVSLDVA